LAGIPESVVLYCARHRFSTDAMEGTGNVMAVMDAMGHQSVNTARIYTHSNVQQIREAIERRNQLSANVCGSCTIAGHKSGHSRMKQPCQEMR
jgi:integrase